MRTAAILLSLALLGCQQRIQHGLDEQQANEIQSLLQGAGIEAKKVSEGGRDNRWSVAVPPDSASVAIRLLSENDLPRQPSPGFGEVFGKGSMVPTAVEENALYVHALSGEIAKTLTGLDGVVHARVHLVIGVAAQPSALRPPVKPRASVLLKTRSGKSAGLLERKAEIQALVAGSVEGLDPDAVSLMVSEIPPAPSAPRVGSQRDLRPLLAGAAVLIAVLSAGLTLAALYTRRLRLNTTVPSADAAELSGPSRKAA